MDEFQFIEKLRKKSCARLKSPLGIGDDCAWIPSTGMLSAVDTAVEGTHFKKEWGGLNSAIYRVVSANVSDINAMGGQAEFILLSLGMNPDWNARDRQEIIDSLDCVCSEYQIQLIGGDTVSAPVGFFSVTILGTCFGEPLVRSGARLGHKVYLSNYLGLSRLGLETLSQKPKSEWDKLESQAVHTHLFPQLPYGDGKGMGQELFELKENSDQNTELGAMIDVSDGLSSELHHLAKASGVGFSIELDRIIHPLFREKLSLDQIRELAWNSGEEYQLLFTAKNLPEAWNDKVLEIGRVISEPRVYEEYMGNRQVVSAAGFKHF